MSLRRYVPKEVLRMSRIPTQLSSFMPTPSQKIMIQTFCNMDLDSQEEVLSALIDQSSSLCDILSPKMDIIKKYKTLLHKNSMDTGNKNGWPARSMKKGRLQECHEADSAKTVAPCAENNFQGLYITHNDDTLNQSDNFKPIFSDSGHLLNRLRCERDFKIAREKLVAEYGQEECDRLIQLLSEKKDYRGDGMEFLPWVKYARVNPVFGPEVGSFGIKTAPRFVCNETNMAECRATHFIQNRSYLGLTPESMYRHVVEVHFYGIRTHKCQACGMTFKAHSYLADHLEAHRIMKRFQCKECGHTSNFLKDIKKHCKAHLDIFDFHCDKCPRKYNYHRDFQRHVKSHEKLPKPKVCLSCHDKPKFWNYADFTAHRDAVHESIFKRSKKTGEDKADLNRCSNSARFNYKKMLNEQLISQQEYDQYIEQLASNEGKSKRRKRAKRPPNSSDDGTDENSERQLSQRKRVSRSRVCKVNKRGSVPRDSDEQFSSSSSASKSEGGFRSNKRQVSVSSLSSSESTSDSSTDESSLDSSSSSSSDIEEDSKVALRRDDRNPLSLLAKDTVPIKCEPKDSFSSSCSSDESHGGHNTIRISHEGDDCADQGQFSSDDEWYDIAASSTAPFVAKQVAHKERKRTNTRKPMVICPPTSSQTSIKSRPGSLSSALSRLGPKLSVSQLSQLVLTSQSRNASKKCKRINGKASGKHVK